MSQALLHMLAAAVGIDASWRDVNGQDHDVGDDTLRRLLEALGLPAATDGDLRDSWEQLRQETEGGALPLVTAALHQQVLVAGRPGPFRLTLESGFVIDGMAIHHGPRVAIPAIHEPGYHRLEFDGAETTIAVAPARAYTLDDAGGGQKLWGLAAQLYALRRKNDGGIGDFGALVEFVEAAARRGADAVAISPVHAQFCADVTRYGPYAPSNRAALNALHIPLDIPGAGDDALIDWPRAGALRLNMLRADYAHFHDHAALEKFRHEAGEGLYRHAVFEALTTTLTPGNPGAIDYRSWPLAYQEPDNPAVIRFIDDNPHEVGFHLWLQYRADAALQAAQQAARHAGMKIGLIADLAVGTDHAGSHSWSRQDEVLRGLEIGAPPDLINREGQSWGITAFSPRGLRNSGFSAFIDMLRHALRHAGGVRIDHVMGLARLWVIPQGFHSADGAYLRLPVDDLMRLVALESQRHKAVILGEDLGTLPHGFSDKLDHAGIAGLRVMWFERHGEHFNPPENWTRTAVAMTTTHDLPSVAGWWQGADIAWRTQLNMAGESLETRAADRVALWAAFQASGATTEAMPAADDGAKAADAACAHLGRSACTLALLPIEDALGSIEQPNLPGTLDEHPNWRRRLSSESETLLARPDVAARLNALNEARHK